MPLVAREAQAVKELVSPPTGLAALEPAQLGGHAHVLEDCEARDQVLVLVHHADPRSAVDVERSAPQVAHLDATQPDGARGRAEQPAQARQVSTATSLVRSSTPR